MPFGPAFAPSLGLSLLKAELARHDVVAEVLYPSIRFAEIIGQHFYNGIAVEGRPSPIELAGEWVFSAALFDRPLRDDDPFVNDVLVGHANWTHRFAARRISPALIRRLLDIRRSIPAFLDHCVEEVLARQPRVVGFTSVFQQHTASLALARLVKRARPDITVLFGGANCESTMGAETVRQFPFVDAALSGEGELVVPELVKRAIVGESLEGLPGVRTATSVARDFEKAAASNAPPVTDLDALPHPDYSDYMRQFKASRLDRDWIPTLHFETSRGCWWGERQHCTFCGLNGSTMTYRSKTAGRALDELIRLSSAYPDCDVQVSDNILDLAYFKDFLPALAAKKLGVKLFYETKANLKREQIRLLRDAGVLEIQPGIESFSDSLLRLMRKGVSALQNVQLLKWCKEFGVQPVWNVLWGFPGEPPEEYVRMAALVPKLAHLPPPAGFGGLRLDRFSPNFTRAAEMGFRDVGPLPSYRHIYGFSGDALANIAYSFTYRYADDQNAAEYARGLLKAVRAWQRVQPSCDLFSLLDTGRLLIWDSRPGARATVTSLTGLDALLYEACDHVSDFGGLLERARGQDDSVTAEQVHQRLASLVERDLMIADGSRYLALAIRVGDYVPAAAHLRRLRRQSAVRSVYRPTAEAPTC